MSNDTENTPIKVAKINATQGVLIALITAAVTLATSYWALGNRESQLLTNPQRWLVIQGIDGPSSESVRIVVSVNGILYAYPADVPYTKIGLSMAEQKLPLPSDSDNYTLAFEAQFKGVTASGFSNAKSRSRPTFEANNLPNEKQTYLLHGVIGDEKAAEVGLTLYFRFE